MFGFIDNLIEKVKKPFINYSQKTYLNIVNDTNFSFTIKVSDVDHSDWDGDGKPNINFHNTPIPSKQSVQHREEINSANKSSKFTMRLEFNNGHVISFRVNQHDVFNPLKIKQINYSYHGEFGGANEYYLVSQTCTSFSTNTLKITSQTLLNSDWMAKIDDRTSLLNMSIPGTHDSISRAGESTSVTGELPTRLAICQSYDLKAQLYGGVRYLDIRMKAIKKKGEIMLQGFHGVVEQKESFNDVLDYVISFLADHPTEAVLIQLKQESSNESEFADIVFTDYVNDPKYKKYFFIRESVPTLGEARGKIVLLNRFTNKFGFGVNVYKWDDDRIFSGNEKFIRADGKLNQENRKITALVKDKSGENYYLFSGKEYLKYNIKKQLVTLGWQNISSNWRGLDRPITGACWHPLSGLGLPDKIIFFSGTEYCEFDWSSNTNITSKDWNSAITTFGVDRPIDQAYTTKSEMYLFSGEKYFHLTGFELFKSPDGVNQNRGNPLDVVKNWKGPKLITKPRDWSEFKSKKYNVQDAYELTNIVKSFGQLVDQKMGFINTFFRDFMFNKDELNICYCTASSSKNVTTNPHDFSAKQDGINERMSLGHLIKNKGYNGIILFDFINAYSENIDLIIDNNDFN